MDNLRKQYSVILYSCSSCTLTWQKPSYDGGQKIIGYNVEKQEYPDVRWSRANFNLIPETTFDITGIDTTPLHINKN